MYVCMCMQFKEGGNASTNNCLFYALFFLATVSRGGICTEAFVEHEKYDSKHQGMYVCMYVCMYDVCTFVSMYSSSI